MIIQRTHTPQTFYAGDRWQIDMTIYQADAVTPLDLSTIEIEWKFAISATDEIILTNTTSNGGIYIVDAVAGQAMILVSPATSASIVAGEYQDQVRILSAGGSPTVILVGHITVKEPL